MSLKLQPLAPYCVPPVQKKSSSYFSLPVVLRAIVLVAGLWKVIITWRARSAHVAPPCVGYLCYSDNAQLALLAISRFTAGITYATLAILFACKLTNTRCAVQQSFLSVLVDFEPTHELHIEHGMLFTLASFVHGAAHAVRVALQRQNAASWATPPFVSGAIMLFTLVLIVPPMSVPALQNRINYGMRKALHFAFVPCLVAFCFHAFHCAIAGIVLLGWYILDSAYLLLFRSYLVEHPDFLPAGGGTSVRFALPKNYTFRPGQYIYVNVPWISRTEWHPFSIIHAPAPAAPAALRSRMLSSSGRYVRRAVAPFAGGPPPPSASFYAAAVGDWTQELYARSLSSVRRPIWISRPMPSPSEVSLSYDRLLLVGMGVGVTPLLSMIERYRGLKRMNLLWASRDAHMVQHFVGQVARGVDSARIFYTGRRPDDFDWLAAVLGDGGDGGEDGGSTCPPSINAMAYSHTKSGLKRPSPLSFGDGHIHQKSLSSSSLSTSTPTAAVASSRPPTPVAAPLSCDVLGVRQPTGPWGRMPSGETAETEAQNDSVDEDDGPDSCRSSRSTSLLTPTTHFEPSSASATNEKDVNGLGNGPSGINGDGSVRVVHATGPPQRSGSKRRFSLPRKTSVTAARWFEVAELPEGSEDGNQNELDISGNDGGGADGGSGGSRPVRVYETRPRLGEEVRRALLSSCTGVEDASWREQHSRVFRSDTKLEVTVDNILRKSSANRLSWWAVVYCGRSTSAAEEIREACSELRVKFRHETFAQW